jgi:hypothetical protein
MKIYEARIAVDRLRSATYINWQDQTDDMKRLGVPLTDCWRTLALKSYKPKRPTGLFIQISLGEFILTKQAEKDETLLELLKPDGEFLPVTVDGKPMRFHNVTRFTDCLDYEKSQWRWDMIGQVPGGISHPRFIPEKVPVGRMFRLMEYPGPRYLATDPSLPPESDFYQWYHHQGYDGLLFKLMWDSEKPDELHGFY